MSTMYKFAGHSLELSFAGIARGGKRRVAYCLRDPSNEIIFEGDDFCASPLRDCEGPESARALLTFLTLRPGDVEAEYFASYTTTQIAWRDNHAEYLYLWTDDQEGEAFDSIEAV